MALKIVSRAGGVEGSKGDEDKVSQHGCPTSLLFVLVAHQRLTHLSRSLADALLPSYIQFAYSTTSASIGFILSVSNKYFVVNQCNNLFN